MDYLQMLLLNLAEIAASEVMIGAQQIGVYSIFWTSAAPAAPRRPAHTPCARHGKPFKSRPVTGSW